MKETEELLIKVVQREEAKQTCTCDICGRQIYKRSLKESPELPKNLKYVDFYEATTGHNDWGNDSVDSIYDYDICSAECLNELFNGVYLNATTNAPGSNRINQSTQYIEIQHKCVSCYEGNGPLPKQEKVEKHNYTIPNGITIY